MKTKKLLRPLLFIAVVMACFALAPIAQSAPTSSPGPTASPGPSPTGNTSLGSGALSHNTTGIHNTAVGYQSMFNNTTGNDNSAQGYQSLFSNTTASNSNAVGSQALYSNTTGEQNNAIGEQALFSNTTGLRNVAVGNATLLDLTDGDSNTAVGGAAMAFSGVVNFNTALGRRALFRVQGDQNIGLGFFAGSNAGDGSTNNIYIGNVGPDPIGSESNTIRIGTQTATTATIGNPPIESHPMPAHTDTYIAGIYGATTSDAGSTLPVYVDVNGKLGTAASAVRFKNDVQPMDKNSEAVLALNPVSFHYKNDSKGIPQFGLIAEEVAKVNPNLVVRDAKGEIYTVRYEAVNAMLLNEFLKEHRKVQELEKQVEKLTAGLQKVSDELELKKPAPQMAGYNP